MSSLTAASRDANALEIHDLSGPLRYPSIFNISLAAKRGSKCVVLGPIHAGKTMLLRHMVGLEQGSSGTIAIEGEEFSACGESDVVLRRMRTRLGVVFQGAALIGRLSVLENVELPLLEHTEASAREARDRAHELLAAAGVDMDADLSPSQIDRAARRRVALARALALRPPVLLLDEPTNDLDPHAAAELDQTIGSLQDQGGFTVLVFSHEVRHAFGRADIIYVMANGTVIDSGRLDELASSENEIVRRLINRRGGEDNVSPPRGQPS